MSSVPEYELGRSCIVRSPDHTTPATCLRRVRERVEEGNLKYLVVASISGQTALRTAEKLEGLDVSIVWVFRLPRVAFHPRH